ncbi:hypothetical protein F5890DRAFT_1421915 [Lentinula detonsa]|uniref:DDE-1 domain-containing protein n=1 Tax=Lentinula detonsa TaxID=2804962 RepID=A0AA38PNU5_9AGAR|nr:hypothetical protein F5890DRAFT_1421915 [Lentinula detonsa]
MDEKGIQLGGGRHNSQERYFYSRKDKMMYKQKGESLELVTIIDCVCADGTAPIKPAFVFAGATKFDDWFEVDDDILCVFHSDRSVTGLHLRPYWYTPLLVSDHTLLSYHMIII